MNGWHFVGPWSDVVRVLPQMPQYLPTAESEWRDYCQEPAAVPELPFAQCPCPPRGLPWQGPAIENGNIHSSLCCLSVRLPPLIVPLQPLHTQDTNSGPPSTRTDPPTASPRRLHWTPASDPQRRFLVKTPFRTLLALMDPEERSPVTVQAAYKLESIIRH